MIKALQLQIRGTVQGVGFRPWVFRSATLLELKGFVRNTATGVCIEIEGPSGDVDRFLHQLRVCPPVHCKMTECLIVDKTPVGFSQFQILPSLDGPDHHALVLPDIASCWECLKEVFDANDRRYLYPFTNCTHCGPRYSIIEALPYDRKNTSMKKFAMCPACQKEYDDPFNRRFHAQPNACCVCGPSVTLLDNRGGELKRHNEALVKTVDCLKEGRIVAVKAMGGFYLMVDAANTQSVDLLRLRKVRPHKPLAVMMPSLSMVEQYCRLGPLEKDLIQSPQAPIVLLPKADGGLKVSESVAPENPYLGCMLSSIPLLHILLRMLSKPVVATSGNLSEEPICIDNNEALSRLSGIADFFLVHDRDIVRHVDDSILHLVGDEPCLLRRARGFAPLPVEIGKDCDGILCTGAHQKNTVAQGLGTSAVISQHIGDLDSPISCSTFEETIRSLKSIYDAPIKEVICDLHPDYASSRFSRSLDLPIIQVQHHHAHVASCMAEHDLAGEVLGVSWDGTGYGPDGTVWGGEFLVTDGCTYERLAHLKLFALPGNEQAIKEPRRSALGLLYPLCEGDWGVFGDLACVKAFSKEEISVVKALIKQKINTPLTSSMGRLFDGIASMLDLCQKASFEGQAAMALEFKAQENLALESYRYNIIFPSHGDGAYVIDWLPIVEGVTDDIRAGINVRSIATRFHQTLVDIIVDMARCAHRTEIVLTGGCFQNKWLLQHAQARLQEAGFKPYGHRKVPAHDGGISLGQMFVAASLRHRKEERASDVFSNTRKN